MKIVRKNRKNKDLDFASLTLTLMSRESLRNKQTINFQNCSIKKERYNVVITLLKQKI